MNLMEAATIMQGELIGADLKFLGASSDTRTIVEGGLFFAWRGANFDGHRYLAEAAGKGAVAAVVEEHVVESDLPQIVVKDSQKALGLLAKAWREAWHGTLIALTGSNGKTTLKEMCASILNQRRQTLATDGNYNNHVGCPLTLLRLRAEDHYGVIEMGANDFGEIDYLTHLAQPDIAIINNAGACHLEGFGSVEGVARAKGEIFNALKGTAIINGDDAHSDYWLKLLAEQGHPAYTFGLASHHTVYADSIEGSTFQLHQKMTPKEPQTIAITLNLIGRHNIQNATAAAAATLALGITMEEVKAGLEALQSVAGRLEQIPLSDHITLINDGYNANPNSLKAGIDALTSDDRWVVLGDMRELGAEERAIHRECGIYAKSEGVSRLFTIGTLSEESTHSFGEGGYHFETHTQLIEALKGAISQYEGDSLSILVKGSNSMNMQSVIEQLRP